MKINDAIFGAIFALLGAVILVHVQAFPKIPGQQYGPAIFPGLVAAGLIACGLLLVFYGMRHRAEQPWVRGGDWLRSRRHVVAVASIVLGMVVYIGVAERVGFLLVAPPLLVLWFRVLGVRWRTAIVAALITTFLIWYAFYKLLRVPLPWGVLTPWAF